MHVIKACHLEARSNTVDTFVVLKVPCDITKLRPFLCLHNVFQRFVLNFARNSAPLNCKLLKYQLRVYTELSKKELDELRMLREKRTSPPVLALSRS